MRHARALLTTLISVALVGSSTAASAANATLPRAQQADAWMALSMLTPTGAAALGTAGVAAAQADAPMPPPPPPEYRGSSDTTWMLIGSTLILAALLAWALSEGGDRDDNDPVSPF